MKQYNLVLKNEKERSYKRISIFLLILNFISILFITYLNEFSKWGPPVIALIAAFSVFASLYFRNRNERITFSAAFFLFSLAWQTANYWVPAALNLVLLILNGFASQKPLVAITEQSISYPSFPKKQIGWNDLNNLVLKDGLLTIDFKNNRLIQQLIDEKQVPVDEKEFNEFCRQQLNK